MPRRRVADANVRAKDIGGPFRGAAPRFARAHRHRARFGRRSMGARSGACTRYSLLAILSLAVSVAGCAQPPAPPTNEVSASTDRGPLKLTLTASPKDVLIGDPIRIDLAVQAPDEYVVRFPPSTAFGDLPCSRIENPATQPVADAGLIHRQTYVLETLGSGKLEIPAVAVDYAKKPVNPADEPAFDQQLSAGPLTLEVRSALTSQDSTQKPRDIYGTVAIPAPPWTPLQWALATGGVLLTLGVLSLLISMLWRLARRPAAPLTPEAWALRKLDELAAAGWFAKGQIAEHYYRLTEIVRNYIEQRFHLRAPEMTTEEFLATLSRDRASLPCDPQRLRLFLDACDIVKYAAFAPRAEDASAALETARAFVKATAAAAAERERLESVAAKAASNVNSIHRKEQAA